METSRKIFWGIAIYAAFLVFLFLFFKNNVVAADVNIFLMVMGLYNPYAEAFFNIVTYIGSTIFWLFMIILFWLDNKRKISIRLLYVFILDTLAMVVLKTAFMRSRPFEVFHLGVDMDINMGPSFPSGHTERAFSGAFILSQYYRKYSIFFYSLAILIAVSRVYLGLHFPFDTLIGALNGLMIALLSLAIPTKKIEDYFKKKNSSKAKR